MNIRISIVISLCCAVEHSVGAPTVTVGPARGSVVYATYAPKPHCPYLSGPHPAQVSGVFLIHITADGRVSAVDAVNSTASSVLDNEAITTFRKWRFRAPGRSAKVKIPITFVLSQ